MKKILLGIVTTIVVLAIAITSVNAASVSTAEEVKKGNKITITVDLGTPADSMDVSIEYESDIFTYVDKSAKCVTTEGGSAMLDTNPMEGRVNASAASADNVVKGMTFEFTSNELTDGATFTIDVNGEKITKTVKVIEDKTVSPDPINPTPNPTPDPVQPGKPSTPIKEEKPKVIPQAGVPYIVLGVAGIVTLGAIVTVKKIVK